MRTLGLVVLLGALAHADPARKVAEVTIGKVSYEPDSARYDEGPIRGARERFLACYQKSLKGYGFPTFEATYKVVLPINANGTLAPPTISKDVGPDNTGTAAAETCLTKEIKKLRFSRGTAHKARFTIALHLR